MAQYIAEHHLFTEDDTVIVAVSGGADSVALLDILSSLADLHLRPVVAHLNHTLRGEESDADEEFVLNLAQSYGLPAELERVDVKEFSRMKGLSLEEGGRVARYSFFNYVARRYGANAVALGHHADDQAETVLMRLLRGSGTTGLCAMAPKSGENLVRPLLAATRREIEAYLHGRGLSYRHDSSNSDTGFLRNRIRHELIPCLETYNPAIRDRLVAMAETLARDEEVLELATAGAFARSAGWIHDKVTLDIAGCRAEPAGLRYRLYRRAVREVRGGLERIGSRHLRDIDSMMHGRKPHLTLCLPDGMMVVKSYGTISFYQTSHEEASYAYELTVAGPGVFDIPGRYRLTVEEGTHHGNPEELPRSSAWFDAAAAPFPWLVRPFRAGDRIVPLGMTGHKKVKDLFIDEKIPLERRRRIPLFFSGDTLIWVGTVRPSAEVSVTGQTRRVIHVGIIDMQSLMDL